MTLAEYEHRNEVALTTSQDVAIQRLSEWARSAEAAHHIATTLVQTSFCPDQFRGKAGEATAAILAGLEIGLQPMAALRSFDIINNTAAPRAITLRAVVQSQGHEMVLVESTETRCKMKGRRKGESEWSTVTWTMDRAKQLGVTGKSNWKNQPQAMLVARATSELARLVASDAILGVGYSSEEVADGGASDAPAPLVADEPNGTRRMSRKQPEPEPPAEEPTDAEPVESPPLNTSSKLAKAMFAAMGEAGITERDARLLYVSDVVGREVTSSSDMSETDARAVLDALKDDAIAAQDATAFPPAQDAEAQS